MKSYTKTSSSFNKANFNLIIPIKIFIKNQAVYLVKIEESKESNIKKRDGIEKIVNPPPH